MNKGCKTGRSPSGHCGAAFYCGKPYTCCAACAEGCNVRCGWLPKREGEEPDGKKGSVTRDQ